MALMAWSSEMSFSLSRLRNTLRSMSIAGRSKLRLRVPELHLDGTGAQRGVAETAAGLRVIPDVQRHPVRIGRDDPAGQGPGVRGGDLDQAPDRAPPVPLIGQRPVDAGRRHFERVGEVAHDGRGVEYGEQLAADRGGVVQA